MLTQYGLSPERQAFYAANFGLEFEGFCDYSKAVHNITMELMFYTNDDGDVMIWNETTVFEDAPWNVVE